MNELYEDFCVPVLSVSSAHVHSITALRVSGTCVQRSEMKEAVCFDIVAGRRKARGELARGFYN